MAKQFVALQSLFTLSQPINLWAGGREPLVHPWLIRAGDEGRVPHDSVEEPSGEHMLVLGHYQSACPPWTASKQEVWNQGQPQTGFVNYKVL